MKSEPDYITLLCIHLRELGLEPVTEYQFHARRKWRFDVCVPESKLACEVDGGAYTRGRHTRGAGFIADMEKSNQAQIDGWKLLRFTPDQIRRGEDLEVLENFRRL